MVNIEKIIEINKKFGGSLLNKSNLEFDTDMANKSKDIYRSNAHLLRGIVQGHTFFDGNKKTASAVVLSRFRKHGIKCNENQFAKGIVSLAQERNTPIKNIERRLKRWCPRR